VTGVCGKERQQLSSLEARPVLIGSGRITMNGCRLRANLVVLKGLQAVKLYHGQGVGCLVSSMNGNLHAESSSDVSKCS